MNTKPKRGRSSQRKDRQREILEIIRYDGKHRYTDVRDLKSQSVADLRMAFGRLRESEIASSTLLSGAYPQSLSELGRAHPVPKAGSLERELAWLFSICSARHLELNRYLVKKNRFEQLLLGAEFSLAAIILDDIENTFGQSLWLIESRFAVAQMRGGFQENRSFLADIRHDCDNDFLMVICQFLSERSEDDVSRNHLHHELAVFCDAQMTLARQKNLEGTASQFVDFIKGRIDFHRESSNINLRNFLYVSGFFSLIDQYLAFLQVLQHQFVFSPQSAKEILLDPKIEDIEEKKLLLMRTVVSGHIPAKARRLIGGSLNEMIELYTRGEYEAVRHRAIDAITHDASQLENYELLVKACLHLKDDSVDFLTLGPIANEIASTVHEALSRNESSAHSLHRLMKEGLRISSSQFADQTIAFFYENRVPSNITAFNRLAIVNAQAITPKITTGISDPYQSIKMLENFDDHGVPQTASLFRSIANGKIISESAKEIAGIPAARLAKYRGQYLEVRGYHQEAIAEFGAVWNDKALPAFQHSDALAGLYRCLMAIGEHDACASVIVDGALRNMGLLLSLRLDDLLKALKVKATGTVDQTVNRSLVFWIGATFDHRLWEDDQVYDIAEDLFIRLRLTTPADIVNAAVDIAEEKMRRFLESICVPSVICSWPSFAETGTEGVENERIKILEHLREKYPDQQEGYSSEIAELRRLQAIRRGIRHIDETKIFINVEGIKDSLDDTFREKYSRLLKIVDLPHERLRRGIVALNLKGLEGFGRLVILTKTGDDGLKVFEELFELIKTRYIASDEHGLDSYIGMQIRHGTMSNQLRAVFERQNLVTEELDSEYATNQFWLVQNDTADQLGKECIDGHLRDFSKAIDAINEEVRTQWIQVSVEKEASKALFDYHFSAEEISRLYASLDDFEPIEAFVDAMFDALSQRTETNLENARGKIEGELERRFVDLIESLETRVEHLLASAAKQRFRRSIEECRTDIHETCKRVSSWFRLSTQLDFYDFDFEEAVRAASDIVSSFPNFLENPKIEVNCHYKFGGASFRSFINLLFILLENVAKHAEPSSEEVLISAVEREGILSIAVANPLSPETDIDNLRAKVNSIENAVSFHEFRDAIRSEGKSGLPKILKILDVDLRQKEPRIKFSVDQEKRRFLVSVSVNIGDLP